MKILIVDNYDSFTFNLVQLLGKNKHRIKTVRNDEFSIDDIKAYNPNKILISPGPGRPENSKLSLDVIDECGKQTSILGVCLGMQAICYNFGCEIINSKEIFHGKTSSVKHNGEGIFSEIPQEFEAMRYHSLIVKRNSITEEFEITATTQSGIVMGIKHKRYPIEGIQFHPESILTSVGDQIIRNWLEQ